MFGFIERVRAIGLWLWQRIKSEKIFKLLQIIQVCVWFLLLLLGGQNAGGISYISENVAVLREQVKSLEAERDTWQEAFEKTLALLQDTQRRNIRLQTRMDYIAHCLEQLGKARAPWEDAQCTDIIEGANKSSDFKEEK